MCAAARFPNYPRKPHKSGTARISIRVGGKRRDYYLGAFGSKESLAEYARLATEFAAGHLKPPAAKPPTVKARLTIADLIAQWLKHEPRGVRHPEVARIARACVPLDRLYGTSLAAEFDARKLADVQEAMVHCRWMTQEERDDCGDWSRGYINVQIKRILRVFKWAERVGHVPSGTWQHLRTIEPIRKTDRRVRSMPPRSAVDWKEQVAPALPHLPATVAAMVQVQFLGAMRPGEVCVMRPMDLDRDTKPGFWLYKPFASKNDWRENVGSLIKVLNQEAQAILAPWLLLAGGPEYPVFQSNRKLRTPYTTCGYSKAIRRACEAAKVKPWTAYQLRHLAKRLATRLQSSDAARAFLGQLSLEATNHYDHHQDVELAASVAAKIRISG